MLHLQEELLQIRSLLQLTLVRVDAAIAAAAAEGKDGGNTGSGEGAGDEFAVHNYAPNSRVTQLNSHDYAIHPNVAQFTYPNHANDRDGTKSLSDNYATKGAGAQLPGSNTSVVVAGAVLPTRDALYAVLRAEVMKGTQRRSARAAARLLLHLSTQSAGKRHTREALAAAAGLSLRSVLAHTGLLERRGLLEKVGSSNTG